MELSELEKKYKELGEEIERFKKEQSKKIKVWKPKEKEPFWLMDSTGDTAFGTWSDSTTIHKTMFELGNCFKTKSEAESVSEKIKIYTKLKRLAEEINTEPIDWKNVVQEKFYIYYDCDKNKIDAFYYTNCKDIGQIYCTNKNFLKTALEQIGEENLLKLFKE